MKTLTKNTVFDTPSFAVNTQLESTGIRELSQDEIELVNGYGSGSISLGALAIHVNHACGLSGFFDYIAENEIVVETQDDLTLALGKYMNSHHCIGV